MELNYLYELYFSWINEGRSQNEINELLEVISLLEFTSATGGPSGSSGASLLGVGSIGVNVGRTGVGPVPASQPSRASGAINGQNWINGGKTGTDDIAVPFNPSGPNRVFQKIPAMGKGHGARTGKKSRIKGIDLMTMRNLLKNKNKQTDMKPTKTGKVMNFDDFQKDQFSQVTKIKEGKTDKSAKPDKKVGKEGLRLTDKKENFRTEVKNLVKSHKEFSIEQVGNDFSISKGDNHIIQVMFRDDYVGIKKAGNKFADEFKYNELGKLKSKINEILKSKKD